MLQERLQEIGFSQSEAKIYTELLKIGPQAVSVIAKRLSMNRTTAYSILNSLEKKGVVSSYINKNVKFFSANDPNCFVAYLDRKCQIFKYHRSQFLNMVPQFREIVEKYDFKKPIISYFEGKEGVKHVIYDSITVQNELRSYVSINKDVESELKDFLIEYKNIRINKKIPLKAIVPDAINIREFFNNNYNDNMTEILYVSPRILNGLFEGEMNIYDDKVCIINLSKGDEYGVVIQSKEIANMHKIIFDVAWNGFKMIDDTYNKI